MYRKFPEGSIPVSAGNVSLPLFLISPLLETYIAMQMLQLPSKVQEIVMIVVLYWTISLEKQGLSPNSLLIISELINFHTPEIIRKLYVTLREKCANTEFFLVRIQSEYRKLRTRKNSIFGHFSRSVNIGVLIISGVKKIC